MQDYRVVRVALPPIARESVFDATAHERGELSLKKLEWRRGDRDMNRMIVSADHGRQRGRSDVQAP